ncbi:MAG: cytochrome c3 family protein [Thermodesulfobacteriota bacterium]
MKKRNLKSLIVAGTAVLTLGIGGAASQVIPEKEITLEGKRPVHFNHKSHLDLGLTCGDCHHDAEHQPLTAETINAMDDKVQLKCDSCHNKDFQKEELQKGKDVFHSSCKDCHSKEINGKKGPTKCSSCHVRQQRKIGLEGC